MLPTQLVIDGELRDARTAARSRPSIRPTAASSPRSRRLRTADVDAAVTAARGAFEGAWAKTAPAKRARMLNRLAQLLDEQTDALAELESRNNGKAKWQCVAEIKVAVATLELFAGTAQHLYGRSHVVNPAVVSYTLTRAGRRGRRDHPVELPADDGRLEGGARRWRPGTRWSSSPHRPRR